MGARPCSRFSGIARHVIPVAARAGSSGPRDIGGVVVRSLEIAGALARRRSVRAGGPASPAAGPRGLPLAGALLRAALGPCSALGASAGFLPLLVLPSALLG